MSTRLGIISDTHGEHTLTRKAVKIFENAGVSEVIHCGDVGTEEIVRLLAQFPCHYVRGNTDSQSLRMWVIRHGQTFYGSVGVFLRDDKRIAFTHGDDWVTLEDLIHSGKYNLICYGHTHEYAWRIEGETRLLNPGAFLRTTPTVAVVDVPEMTVEKFRVE